MVVQNRYLFAHVRVSQQGVCVLRCLRRPEPPEKYVPDFLEYVPYHFSDFLQLLLDFRIFVSVLGSPGRVHVCCTACGASEPSEKHVPGILEHVPGVFYCLLLIL